MSITVCTLFEGNYHYGVAGLVNSLVLNGYKGIVYVGYRGELPPWANECKASVLGEFSDVSTFEVSPEIEICFVPVKTERHLTNYKAPFMLQLFEALPEADGIFYFDPDICVNGRWSYFEEWIECGVALCEDGNSPFYKFHPRRVGWRNYYREHGIELQFKFEMYINAGSVGVMRRDIEFLETWEHLMQLMAPAIDGLDQTIVGGGTSEKTRDFLFCFMAADQDALNAAVEASSCHCSVQNKSAMGLASGLAIVPHAFGLSKPWNSNYLKNALMGSGPRTVDKVFWLSLQKGPLKPFKQKAIDGQMKKIKASSLVGRMIRRG